MSDYETKIMSRAIDLAKELNPLAGGAEMDRIAAFGRECAAEALLESASELKQFATVTEDGSQRMALKAEGLDFAAGRLRLRAAALRSQEKTK